MGDRLSEIEVFIETAERGSLTAAARSLGISTTAASRRLASLEERLGVRLLERTTRHMSLTEPGKIYLTESRHLLRALDALDGSLQAPASEPVSLTLHTPPPLDLLLPALLSALPQLTLALRDPALADVVLSLGPPTETLRTLGPLRHGLFAAPSWLAAHGTPRTPADLLGVPGLRAPHEAHWRFSESAPIAILPGRLEAASDEVRLRAACAGLGAARLPEVVARAAVVGGQLVRLLPSHKLEEDSWVRAAVAPGVSARSSVRALLGAVVSQLSTDM